MMMLVWMVFNLAPNLKSSINKNNNWGQCVLQRLLYWILNLVEFQISEEPTNALIGNQFRLKKVLRASDRFGNWIWCFLKGRHVVNWTLVYQFGPWISDRLPRAIIISGWPSCIMTTANCFISLCTYVYWKRVPFGGSKSILFYRWPPLSPELNTSLTITIKTLLSVEGRDPWTGRK